ncbi:MAG TPA: phosphotransferase, partial [Gallionella sp.]
MTVRTDTVAQAVQPPGLIRALLSDPACFDHPTGRVQLIETHISWVLLTGEFAYKIKKPVDMGFLDFSTLDKRKHACDEELRLNRRLAPDIYLGVVGITDSSDAPRVNGAGEPHEYAVKMRQFPPDATLDRLSARGELGSTHIDALAALLAQFHLGECDIAAPGTPYGEPPAIMQPVLENFELLAERVDGPVRHQLGRLHVWTLAQHAALTPLMRSRKAAGRLRECHGDLHMGNLAWADGRLIIFDCIEFNPSLR